MRSLTASEWLKNPELEVVEATKSNTIGSDFTLFVDQVTSQAQDAELGDKSGAKAKGKSVRRAKS
jgi:Tfp pilus assembly protein PilN